MRTNDEVLAEWRARPHHAESGFVSDGPIDPAQWVSSERRILFLLKEAYGDPTKPFDWDLCEYLRDRIRDRRLGNTYWNVAYWNYALRELDGAEFPLFPESDAEYAAARLGLRHIAVVNLKKSGGKSGSDPADLKAHIARDGDLLKEQIECLDPHVVVCGGTWAFVRKLWPERSQAYDLVWKIGRACIAMDFPHPALRSRQKMPYYSLGVLVHRAGPIF